MKLKFALTFTLIISLLVPTLIIANNQDRAAIELAKHMLQLIKTSPTSELHGYQLNVRRYYQYTATHPKKNPYSYILEVNNPGLLKASGLTPGMKGRYLAAIQDRSSARIERLWSAHRDYFFKTIDAQTYQSHIQGWLKTHIEVAEHPEYKSIMATYKKIQSLDHNSEASMQELFSLQGELNSKISDYNSVKAVGFWYRRASEGNSPTILTIMREIRDHYQR